MREGSLRDQVRHATHDSDTLVEEAVATRDFSTLVDRCAMARPASRSTDCRGADALLNTLEYLIHHEDVRRGEGGWDPRELPTRVEDQLWGQVVKTAKLASLRDKRRLTLRRSDTGDEAVVSRGSGDRLVGGLPSELALYISGRKGAARVGPDPLIRQAGRQRTG